MDLYYDPWDVEIDLDPYPTYRRLRDEQPLYYNERHDFWGISRYSDVDAALRDPQRLSSAKGDILEVVKADPVMPPGVFINEAPPLHTIHRALVGRMFMPKKMRALEDKVRAFCVSCLDPFVGADEFDFVRDLGAELPMRTIGMLVGIPDADQPSVRAQAHAVLRNKPGEPLPVKKDHYFDGDMFTDYVAWRKKNPSDDLITELLNVEFIDETGTTRRLRTDELLIFLAVIAGAGVETTGRLFGWMGKVLAEHPDQRRELVEDPSRIPVAIEELLRFEPPGPHVARFVATDDVMLALYEGEPRPPAWVPIMEQIEDPYLAAFSESAANGLAMPAIPEMSAVWTAWGNAQQLIIQQQVEPADAMTDAAEQIRSAIAGEAPEEEAAEEAADDAS